MIYLSVYNLYFGFFLNILTTSLFMIRSSYYEHNIPRYFFSFFPAATPFDNFFGNGLIVIIIRKKYAFFFWKIKTVHSTKAKTKQYRTNPLLIHSIESIARGREKENERKQNNKKDDCETFEESVELYTLDGETFFTSIEQNI